jgi:hypothetical protein
MSNASEAFTQTYFPTSQARQIMTEQEKRNYNKEHYQKNRSEILERVRSKYKPKSPSLFNVIPLFKTRANARSKDGVKTKQGDRSANNGQPQPRTRWRRLEWGTLFLQILAMANIYFLITETAHFYLSVDGNGYGAYLKALILEGAVFAFSALLKARSAITGLLHKLMIVLIYAYSVWVLSGSVIHAAFFDQAQIRLQEKIVAELETEVSKKTILRDSYFEENRITLASKMDQALDILKQRIEQSRQILSRSPNTSMIWNTLLTLVMFRVLVMASNLLCLGELSRRYRMKLRTV